MEYPSFKTNWKLKMALTATTSTRLEKTSSQYAMTPSIFIHSLGCCEQFRAPWLKVGLDPWIPFAVYNKSILLGLHDCWTQIIINKTTYWCISLHVWLANTRAGHAQILYFLTQFSLKSMQQSTTVQNPSHSHLKATVSKVYDEWKR